MKTLTELSQEDNKRMEGIKDKLISKEIGVEEYKELMLLNSERFKKELSEILNAERKEGE